MHHHLSTVALVLGQVTRERLLELLHRAHVWLIATPAHASLERELWTEHRTTGLPGDITTFTPFEASPEEHFSSIVASIDKHHDERARDGIWTTLEVLGPPPTEDIRQLLARYGAIHLHPTPHGFTAHRP
jgi:hypothetical protein